MFLSTCCVWSYIFIPEATWILIWLTLEIEWHVFREPQFAQFSDSRVTEAVPDPALISTRPLHQRYWRTRRAGQLKCHALNYFCSLQLWEPPRNDTYRGRWGERTVERLDRESRHGTVRAIVEVGKGIGCGMWCKKGINSKHNSWLRKGSVVFNMPIKKGPASWSKTTTTTTTIHICQGIIELYNWGGGTGGEAQRDSKSLLKKLTTPPPPNISNEKKKQLAPSNSPTHTPVINYCTLPQHKATHGKTIL